MRLRLVTPTLLAGLASAAAAAPKISPIQSVSGPLRDGSDRPLPAKLVSATLDGPSADPGHAAEAALEPSPSGASGGPYGWCAHVAPGDAAAIWTVRFDPATPVSTMWLDVTAWQPKTRRTFDLSIERTDGTTTRAVPVPKWWTTPIEVGGAPVRSLTFRVPPDAKQTAEACIANLRFAGPGPVEYVLVGGIDGPTLARMDAAVTATRRALARHDVAALSRLVKLPLSVGVDALPHGPPRVAKVDTLPALRALLRRYGWPTRLGDRAIPRPGDGGTFSVGDTFRFGEAPLHETWSLTFVPDGDGYRLVAIATETQID